MLAAQKILGIYMLHPQRGTTLKIAVSREGYVSSTTTGTRAESRTRRPQQQHQRAAAAAVAAARHVLKPMPCGSLALFLL